MSDKYDPNSNEQMHKDIEPAEEPSKTAYYSYGTYQSSYRDKATEADRHETEHRENERRETGHHETEQLHSPVEELDHAQVEISKPTPVKSFQSDPFSKPNQPVKKKSSVKSLFASFMAGAVVVFSLMFASDQMNLFTPDQGYMSTPPASSGSNESPVTSGVQNASVNAIARPDSISDMVKMAGPAVVKIETMVTQQMSSRYNDDIFRWFFGDGYSVPQEQSQGQLVPGGMGSGFVFEQNGYIFTNQHVIDGAEEIWVEIEGYPKKFKAELLGEDYEMDLAVLKIEGDEPFPTLKIGDSSKVEVGDWVTAIGNPIGFDHSVSVGVLSAKEREISIADDKGSRGPRNYAHLLQTDASINPGNSGGPLLNLNGEVIGMNTAVSTNAQGIGFAIPSNTLIDVMDRLKKGEKIEKPYIGVTLAELDERTAEQLGLKSDEGAVVIQVLRDSPAHLAGLRPYDVITEFNGEKVEDIASLQSKISDAGVGARATITFIRDGKSYDTGIVIGDRNSAS